MKKLIILLISIAAMNLLYSQELTSNPIELIVTKASYEVGSPILLLDIKIKNNTDKKISVLQPKPFLFKWHYPEKDELGLHGLYSFPYEINIKSKKTCKSEYEEEFMATEDGLQTRLLNLIVSIPPKDEVEFKNIEIKYSEASFCKKTEYTIEVMYKPDFKIYEDYQLDEITKLYDNINKETKSLNRLIGYDASNYQSIEPDNFAKLKKFLEVELPSIKALNGMVFKSIEFKASEKE